MRLLVIAFIMPLAGLMPVLAVPTPDSAGPSPVFNRPALVRRVPGVAAPSTCPVSRRGIVQEYKPCDADNAAFCANPNTFKSKDKSISGGKCICIIYRLDYGGGN